MGKQANKNINQDVTRVKPNIAVSYNKKIGGVSSNTLMATFSEYGSNVCEVDYRAVLPSEKGDYDSIYTDNEKMKEVFASAKAKAKLMLAGKDCLVIPGNNAMIDPRLYGGTLKSQNVSRDKIDLARCIAEMAMIDVAMNKGMPILGICGGHQAINVFFGGKLKWLSSGEVVSQSYKKYEAIQFVVDSEIGKIFSPSSEKSVSNQKVFGAHYQAVRSVGGKNIINGDEDYLVVVARSNDKSNNIEAFEASHGATLFGIQFHPEVATKGLIQPGGEVFQASSKDDIVKNARLIQYFIDAATSYKIKSSITASDLEWKRNNLKKVSDSPRLDNLDNGQSTAGNDENIGAKNTRPAIKRKFKGVSVKVKPQKTFLKELRREYNSVACVASAIFWQTIYSIDDLFKRKESKTDLPGSCIYKRPIFLYGLFKEASLGSLDLIEGELNLKQQLIHDHFYGREKNNQVKFVQIEINKLKNEFEKYQQYLNGKITKSIESKTSRERAVIDEAAIKLALSKFETVDEKYYSCTKSVGLKNYINKWNALVELSAAIPTNAKSKSIDADLARFYQSFNKHYETLTSSPDSAAQLFVKAICSFFAVLTLVGIFALPFIWRNQCRVYYDKLRDGLEQVTSNLMK